MLWGNRGSLDDIDLAPAPSARDIESPVTLTWFGVTTMLFDDGETQILIDGFISRPTLFQILTGQPVDNDVAKINFFLNEYRIRRLAAIIPVHSHFDHAMDVGAIGNRSSASVLGSESTAQIARGASVPEDQIVVVEDGADYSFGQFTITFIESVHAPVGLRGSVPMPGTIDAPLSTPAPVKAWREGGSYSIVVSHPGGTTLVQGSGGILRSSLEDIRVDVVMLGVGMIEGLGRDYVDRYWQATVTSTGATTVIPIHFDDFTKPFGTIELMPSFLDDFADTVMLLKEFRTNWDMETRLYLPVFGEPIALYPVSEPEA
ncbi:MAG: MBL fold metallo-hydrolase [Gammaproteobacteria bacterium]|nr:MBL fold metallo-hydrolase [Pseudomonadota bacterium]TDJ39002.1 MAG: MBL fold metallo-hydrolase [Gammaproteobacteria bacterium]